MTRTYPEYPWCCIGIFIISIAGGLYQSFTHLPFTLDPIMGALFGLGGIALVIALVDIHKRSEAQRIMKATIDSHGKGSVNVRDLAEEVEMTERGTRHVITDLRIKGLIKAYFDPKSGVVVIGKEPGAAAEAPPEGRPVNYCQYCGARVPPAAKFCVNCGASIE
nr:zinc ribbon domain-containing protein [Candidatus Njordarchaeota archaeon]